MSDLELNIDELFGEASFEKPEQREYWKAVKLKGDSEFVCRIMPPMKSLVKNSLGYSFYIREHWGYTRPNQKNPKAPLPTPFRCMEVKDRNGHIIRRCPECDRIQTHKETLAQRERQLLESDKTPEEIKELTAPLREWLKKHNTDGKHALNVLGLDGKFYVLKISHKTMKLLRAKLDTIKNQEGINPLSLKEGVYLKFIRIGTRGPDVQDQIEVVKDKRILEGGIRAEVTKLAPLSDADIQRAIKVCPDLAKDVSRELTMEQVKMLVNGDGSPEHTEQVLSLGAPTDEMDESGSDMEESEPEQPSRQSLNADSFFAEWAKK